MKLTKEQRKEMAYKEYQKIEIPDWKKIVKMHRI